MNVKNNEVGKVLQWTINDETGVPVNLTGGSVTLYIKRQDGAVNTIVLTLNDPTAGKANRTQQAADFLPGEHTAVLKIIEAGGNTWYTDSFPISCARTIA